MAEPEPTANAEVLKAYAVKVGVSSIKERSQAIHNVIGSVNQGGVPEAAVKGIFKFLTQAVGHYRDGISRRAALGLVITTSKCHLGASGKAFIAAFDGFAESQKKIPVPSRGSSGDALLVLSWSTEILKLALKSSDFSQGNLKSLMGLQALLVYGAVSSSNKAMKSAAYRKVSRVWKEVPNSLEKQADILTNIELLSFHLPMLSMIMKFMASRKLSDKILKYKKPFLDAYVKQILGSRTPTPEAVLLISAELLRHCSHEDFKGQVLPAAQKSMLRNPEIALQTVCELVISMKLDLSQYALDVGKLFTSQISSKDESTRAVAVQAMKHLAHQCSDPGAVEKLADLLFKVLGGSEGKLTFADQKISVLQGIGSLAYSTVSGTSSVQNLCGTVTEMFLPTLQQEVHEGTLVQSLSMLGQWCERFYTEVPDKLIQWFQKGIALKTSTSAVRNAYLRCMNSAFHVDTLQMASPLVPLFLQTIDKATKQSSQVPFVTEAVTASCLLVKIAMVDIMAESKLTPFWSVILDKKKQLIANEKFISSASEETLQSLIFVLEKLILDFPSKMTEEVSKPYYRALIFCLTHRSWPVRQAALASTKKILSLLGGTQISLSLISEFSGVLQTQKLSDLQNSQNKEDDGAKGDTVTSETGSKIIRPGLMAVALLAISNIQNVDPRDAEKLALATLIPAHHPYIVVARDTIWLSILKNIKLDASNFVSRLSKACIDLALAGDLLSEAQENTIAGLVKVNPSVMAPELVSFLLAGLSKPELGQVTMEEYGIFRTPEGELYDRTILDSAMKSTAGAQNIKRENKLYSYAEQMAEVELRKELERKKGKKPQEAPKLSKKQEEMLDAQKQKESEIRERIIKLHQIVLRCTTITRALLCAHCADVSVQIKEIYESIAKLLHSPLAAPELRDVFIAMGKVTFKDKLFGELLANTVLRLSNAACQIDKRWLDEKQIVQASRVVGLLHKACSSVPKQNGAHDDDDSDEEACDITSRLYPSATFSYIFNLLRCILKNGGSVVKGNTAVCSQVLELIRDHAQMRRTAANVHDVDLYDPDHLPRALLFDLCLKVVGTFPQALQLLANDALLELARCANGDVGATDAAPDEVQVLLLTLHSPAVAVRDIALQCLAELSDVLPSMDENLDLGLAIAKHLWTVCNDPETAIQQVATKLRDELSLDEPCEELCGVLVIDVIHNEEIVRTSVSLALAQCLEQHPSNIPVILQILLDQYEEKLFLPPPLVDEFGRKLEEQPPDEWPARSGVGLALKQMAPLLPEDQILPLFDFFVPKALSDRSPVVRSGMRDAALASVQIHGKDNVNSLLPVFEKFLITAPDSADYDPVRQSIVVLMGNLARHLDADNPKVKPIVAQLIAALSTPSQEVQEAVANCLPPLVPSIKADAPGLVSKLLKHLLDSDNYGERKGAAYGLAGLIKGMGILALKQQQVMETLTQAIQDKKLPRKREGALLAFEMLCTMLGRLFEPYIVHIIQYLLMCFGDSNQYVREAADDCAKAVMKNLSAHGVKLILPSLLKGLEEDQWRTKAGSVELLGAMAFCAPKQLSACLPSIVPKLIEVLTNSHLKVQKAGSQALQQIGSVIRNPEIQAIVPDLLEALQDPTKRTTVCLEKLLQTKFVHFVDAPSLALIMPVIQRAFQDRVTDTRKMAAQIMGNMYSLTDHKDLSPYLPSVIPGLKQCLLDPVPEVRTVSARALGAMVRGMGEETFQDLMPWLMEKLVSEISSVDRSGAAQGMSEVIGGMGEKKLQKVMADIIQTAERPELMPHVRDGYVMTYIYLPMVFGNTFVQYVGPILPSILQALSDENEFVRDTALRAGKRIINQYAETAIELLLPELEKGLFDDNWRIRNSSVQLLGDLLYKVSGVSGKMTTETANEDDNFGTESSQKAITRSLGVERRNRVLSGLYMGRSDTSLMVRQNALHVWKVIVANTPRTLREILPTLFTLLLGCLASTSNDKRTVAARTLGDLVRKLGERVLPEIIPILESGLDSKEADQRQGVCIGLSEIMASTSREHVSVFADSLIPTVRKALVDPLSNVRSAAAHTFDNLHQNIGQRALDEILPKLLNQLNDPDLSERALDGLTQVMAVKSRVVLPYLVPQLISPPVNTKALSLLSSVAGESLTKHLVKILPALMSSLSERIGTPEADQELEYCKSVVLSVEDDLGVRTMMDDLLSVINPKTDARVCTAAVYILNAFCANTTTDVSDYLSSLFRSLIGLFACTDQQLVMAGWMCLDAITKKMDLSNTQEHITNVRQALKFTLSDFKGKELPGFSVPKKGIAPILPIFREGILNGAAEVKEMAALGLGEVIAVTGAEALKPSVVNITGPLIRILGDRFTWTLKVAVLDTLSMLLEKVGVMLKPFLPQLQTTFVKAINDPNRTVRLRAASALGKLIIIHTRVDPLFNELITGFKNSEDTSIKDTFVQAIRACLQGAGSKLADASRRQLCQTLTNLLGSADDTTRMTSAGCLGTLCGCLSEAELADVMIQHILDTDASQEWTLRHGRSMALSVALKTSPSKIWVPSLSKSVASAISKLIAADRIPICLSGLRCAGHLLTHLLDSEDNAGAVSDLETLVIKSMKQDSNDVKVLVCQVLSFIADAREGRFQGDNTLVPALVMGTKEKNSLVKSSSEAALVSILKLRNKDDKVYQNILTCLDSGMQDSLKEVYSKSLRKVATQPECPVKEIDDTILR